VTDEPTAPPPPDPPPSEPWPVDGELVHAALAGTVATLTALTDGEGAADPDRLPEVVPMVTDLDLRQTAEAEVLVAAAIAVTSQVHDLLYHTELLDGSLETWDDQLDQLVACGLEGVHHVLVHHAQDVAAFIGSSPEVTLTRLASVVGPVILQLARLGEEDRRPLLQLVGARADLTARLTVLDRTLDELLLDESGLRAGPPDRPDLALADGAILLLDWLHDHQAHQQDPAPEELPSALEVAAAASAAAAITTAVLEHFDLDADEAFAAFVPFASTSLLLRTLWSAGGAWVDTFAHELASEAPYAVAEDAIETVCTLTRLLADAADPDDADEVAEELLACFQVLAVVDHRDLLDDLELIVDRVLRDPSVLQVAIEGDGVALEATVQQAVQRARAASRRAHPGPRPGGIAVTTTSEAVTVTDRHGGSISLDDPADVALVIRQLAAWAERS
jgi:hypothetical protein